MGKSFLAALLVGAAFLRAGAQTQTPQDIWPAGVNGTKAWPHEYPNSFSKAPGWTFPETGDVPPADLLQRIKCPDGTEKVKVEKAYSTKWETNRWHPPIYAFDAYNVSRWSSWDMNHRWLVADMGAVRTIKQLYLVWEYSRPIEYDIRLATEDVLVTPPKSESDTAVVKWNDNTLWKTAKSVTGFTASTGTKGRVDVVAVEGQGRFVEMLAVKNGSQYGYSLFEFTICAASGTSGVAPRAQASGARRWEVAFGRGGLPLGVRAFDLAGKAMPTSAGAAQDLFLRP